MKTFDELDAMSVDALDAYDTELFNQRRMVEKILGYKKAKAKSSEGAKVGGN